MAPFEEGGLVAEGSEGVVDGVVELLVVREVVVRVCELSVVFREIDRVVPVETAEEIEVMVEFIGAGTKVDVGSKVDVCSRLDVGSKLDVCNKFDEPE